MEIFSTDDVRKLFWRKIVVVIGDSIQRCVYKDLVSLLSTKKNGDYLSRKELKTKGELEFLGDKLVSGGQLQEMSNGVNYREVRQYDGGTTVVKFYFVTRCYSEHMESILNELNTIEPHVVIMNSCLWDVHRYGPHGPAAYQVNLDKLMKGLKKTLPGDAVFIWNAALPLSSKCKGGFLLPMCDTVPSIEILQANFFARNIILSYGMVFLDLHLVFSNLLEHRAADGVHWDHIAHRKISNLVLMKVSQLWNVPVPRKMVAPSLLGKPISRVHSFSGNVALCPLYTGRDRYGFPFSGHSDDRYIVESTSKADEYKQRFKCLTSKALSPGTSTIAMVGKKPSTPTTMGFAKEKSGLLPTPMYYSSPLEARPPVTIVTTASKTPLFCDLSVSSILDSPSVVASSNAAPIVSPEVIHSINSIASSDSSSELNDPSFDFRTKIERSRLKIFAEAYQNLTSSLTEVSSASDLLSASSTNTFSNSSITFPSVRNQSLPDLRGTLLNSKQVQHIEVDNVNPETDVEVRSSVVRDGAIGREKVTDVTRRIAPQGMYEEYPKRATPPVQEGDSKPLLSVRTSEREQRRSAERTDTGTMSVEKGDARVKSAVKRKAADEGEYSKDRKYGRIEGKRSNEETRSSDRERDYSGGLQGVKRTASYLKAFNPVEGTTSDSSSTTTSLKSEIDSASRGKEKGRIASFKAKTAAKLSSVVSRVSSAVSKFRRETDSKKSDEGRSCDKNGLHVTDNGLGNKHGKTIPEGNEETKEKRRKISEDVGYGEAFAKPSKPTRTVRTVKCIGSYGEHSPENKPSNRMSGQSYSKHHRHHSRGYSREYQEYSRMQSAYDAQLRWAAALRQVEAARRGAQFWGYNTQYRLPENNTVATNIYNRHGKREQHWV